MNDKLLALKNSKEFGESIAKGKKSKMSKINAADISLDNGIALNFRS
jgi:hypothetical protein